jgi:hypothetical protein
VGKLIVFATVDTISVSLTAVGVVMAILAMVAALKVQRHHLRKGRFRVITLVAAWALGPITAALGTTFVVFPQTTEVMSWYRMTAFLAFILLDMALIAISIVRPDEIVSATTEPMPVDPVLPRAAVERAALAARRAPLRPADLSTALRAVVEKLFAWHFFLKVPEDIRRPLQRYLLRHMILTREIEAVGALLESQPDPVAAVRLLVGAVFQPPEQPEQIVNILRTFRTVLRRAIENQDPAPTGASGDTAVGPLANKTFVSAVLGEDTADLTNPARSNSVLSILDTLSEGFKPA